MGAYCDSGLRAVESFEVALAACRSYRCWPAFTSEEIFSLAHCADLIVNPKGW